MQCINGEKKKYHQDDRSGSEKAANCTYIAPSKKKTRKGKENERVKCNPTERNGRR